jgi:hypothetical protein
MVMTYLLIRIMKIIHYVASLGLSYSWAQID